MANAQPFACPLCGLVDRVEKVSSLVGSGTLAGFYTGSTSGTGLMAGVSQTALSQKLASPSRPFYDSPYGTGTKFSIGLFGFLTLVSFIALITTQSYRSQSYEAPLWIAEIIIWGTILALIIFFKQRTANKRRRHFEAAMPLYREAYKRWDQLYYCARNDVVFIPGKRYACVPSSQMSSLI